MFTVEYPKKKHLMPRIYLPNPTATGKNWNKTRVFLLPEWLTNQTKDPSRPFYLLVVEKGQLN